MPTFRQGDIVKVPFPYTDRAARQHRPALVISSSRGAAAHGLIWVLMITSAENRGWRGDVAISDPSGAGLPAPSVIRTAKIATIEANDATGLGAITPTTLRQVMRRVGRELGLA